MAGVLANETTTIQRVEPDLTLQGLRLIWERSLGQVRCRVANGTRWLGKGLPIRVTTNCREDLDVHEDREESNARIFLFVNFVSCETFVCGSVSGEA